MSTGNRNYDDIIVGVGIIGSAIAYNISTRALPQEVEQHFSNLGILTKLKDCVDLYDVTEDWIPFTTTQIFRQL